MSSTSRASCVRPCAKNSLHGAPRAAHNKGVPKMNAAQLLVRCLENEGVRYVFGIPGEETLDRAPLVAITGQAGLERVHLESHQYIDVVQMFAPVTKWSTRVSVAESVPEVVRKAFRLARLEKPGATHIELPEDVAKEDVRSAPLELRRTSYPQAKEEAIDRAAEIINAAKSPVILAGNGVARRQAAGHPAMDALRKFVRRSGIYATHTYMAKGVLDPYGPHSLPAAGLQRPGADLANIPQLASADLVIAIGYDFVEWSPSLWNPKRDKVVVHVDSIAAELDGHYQPSVEVVGED